MGNHFSIQLPTKPFLVKYIESLYGSPVVFSSDQYFGMLLVLALTKNVRRNTSAAKIQYKAFEVLNKEITICFPENWITHNYNGMGKRAPSSISTEKAIFITKIFENRFEEDLYRYVENSVVTKGQQRKTAIEDFAKMFGLDVDVDITYDNLKQTEYRFRKEIVKRKLNQEKTPSPLSREKTGKVA